MKLSIRRWTGRTSGGRETRLIVRDSAAGTKVAHVQVTSGWLFMADESRREEVRLALASEGIEVTGPSIDALRGLPFLPDVYCSPGTQQRIKLLSQIDAHGDSTDVGYLGEDRYDLRTGEKLPPALVAEFHLMPCALSICHDPWWDQAVGHLRRLGALPLAEEPAALNEDLRRELQGIAQPVGDDEFLEECDFEDERPAFYGTVLRQWEPGRLSHDELDALRASGDERRRPLEVDSGRRLSASASLLLPDDLKQVVAFSLTQIEPNNGFAEEDRDERDDPRGYYRAWVKPRRYETPRWKYDGRGVGARLDDVLYTPIVDRWLSEHKAHYGGSWATVAAFDAEYEQPDLWRAARDWVMEARAEDPYIGLTLLPGIDADRSATAEFLASRFWRRTRKHGRDWPALGEMVCPICAAHFAASALDPTDVLAPLGPPRWCASCCYGSWGVRNAYGQPDAPLTAARAIEALRHLADTLGYTPSRDWHLTRMPRGMPEEQRDRLLLARMAMPANGELLSLEPGWTWIDWLRAADLVGETVRTPRGTLCTARDGHRCRSLFELAVDDYLDAAGIVHEVEPDWPWHRDFNPTGRRRADWRLADGTYIEAAGLMGDAEYAAKMAEKEQLASAMGIRLIVLTPEDLPNVADVLGSAVR